MPGRRDSGRVGAQDAQALLAPRTDVRRFAHHPAPAAVEASFCARHSGRMCLGMCLRHRRSWRLVSEVIPSNSRRVNGGHFCRLFSGERLQAEVHLHCAVRCGRRRRHICRYIPQRHRSRAGSRRRGWRDVGRRGGDRRRCPLDGWNRYRRRGVRRPGAWWSLRTCRWRRGGRGPGRRLRPLDGNGLQRRPGVGWLARLRKRISRPSPVGRGPRRCIAWRRRPRGWRSVWRRLRRGTGRGRRGLDLQRRPWRLFGRWLRGRLRLRGRRRRRLGRSRPRRRSRSLRLGRRTALRGRREYCWLIPSGLGRCD